MKCQKLGNSTEFRKGRGLIILYAKAYISFVQFTPKSRREVPRSLSLSLFLSLSLSCFYAYTSNIEIREERDGASNRKILLRVDSVQNAQRVHQRMCTCTFSERSLLFLSLSLPAFDLFTPRVRSLRIKVHANGFTWGRYHRAWQDRATSSSTSIIHSLVSSCDLKLTATLAPRF